MRLIFVHGINQQRKNADTLRAFWLSKLVKRLDPADDLAGIDIAMPFYGDALYGATEHGVPGAIAQGPKVHALEQAFIGAAMTEVAAAAGLTARAIDAEQRKAGRETSGEAVELGFPMDRRINAIARLVEKISPLHGSLLIRLLGQAYAYLETPGVAPIVDDLVRPVLQQGPAVIVSHSLGTVVTFKLLRELAAQGHSVTVPLYVTLGSPLAIMSVQAALGPAFTKPLGVGRWLNALDPDDFVTLGRALTEDSFSSGIDNLDDIVNIDGDPHAIDGYIGDPRVANAIRQACRK